MCVTAHVQITQNNKFAMSLSLQCLKKEVSYEVDFLYADKHESFLQTNTISFVGDVQASPEFAK